MYKDAKDQRKGEGEGVGATDFHVWTNAQEKGNIIDIFNCL